MFSIVQRPRGNNYSMFENEITKNYFDKAKKSDIIRNESSLFLKRIIAVKSQDSKKIKSHNSNSNMNYSSEVNKKYYKNEMNKTMTGNITSILKKGNLLIDYNKNHYKSKNKSKNKNKNINFPSPENISRKIYVNKNRYLRNSVKREKQKINDKIQIFNNSNNKNKVLRKQNIDKKINAKKQTHLLNTTDSTELSCSSLYTNKFIRKPIVIKYEISSNKNNLYNNYNYNTNKIFNKTCYNYYKNTNKNIRDESKEKEKEKEKERKRVMSKTDLRIKPLMINEIIEKNRRGNSELFRNFKDLEKKSLELSKRKIKKNFSHKTFDFKKVHDLANVKQSYDNIQKSKSKNKNLNIKKENKNIEKNEINDKINEKNNSLLKLLNFKLLNNKNRLL